MNPCSQSSATVLNIGQAACHCLSKKNWRVHDACDPSHIWQAVAGFRFHDGCHVCNHGFDKPSRCLAWKLTMHQVRDMSRLPIRPEVVVYRAIASRSSPMEGRGMNSICGHCLWFLPPILGFSVAWITLAVANAPPLHQVWRIKRYMSHQVGEPCLLLNAFRESPAYRVHATKVSASFCMC